ncbi:MAG: permease [Acidobacteriota bacterium]
MDPNLLHTVGQATWSVLLSLAPSLLLGATLAGLLHVALPKGFAAAQLRGRGGVVKAVAFGVPLPLCSCGVLPAGIGLKKDGASDGAAVGFLISTPETGVDSMAVSAAFFGWPFAIFKVISATIMGLTGGLLADRVGGGRRLDLDAAAPPALRPSTPPASAPVGFRAKGRAAFGHSVELLRSIWTWLVIGVVLSVAIEVFVPDHVFAGVAAWGGVGAALAALVLSLPLYVCATASVPIAAALVAGGLPAGAALVFLMAGPATNAATVGAIYKSFGGRIFGVYLGTLLIGSFGFGLGFDFVLGETTAAMGHAHDHAAAPWKVALTVGLVAVLAAFAIDDLRRALDRRRRGRRAPGAAEPLSLPVEGMTCSGCVRKLEGCLAQDGAVDEAIVELEPGRATVRGRLSEARLRELIVESGFRVG